MKKLKLAVIGKDVSKSSSPEMHTFIAERMGNQIDYRKISIQEDLFEDQIDNLFSELDGFNVTIPYKLAIIPHLEKIEGDAAVFGAVNTVRTSDKLGENTDGLGFSLMLSNNGVDVSGKEVLLLGAGGAGRSVAKKLSDAGATVYIYDTRSENSRAVAQEFKNIVALDKLENRPFYAIINATGIGMHKTEGLSPASEELISLCEAAIDLIYTPPVSKFLQIAQDFGKKIINGEAMLFYQAYYSECIYFGIKADAQQAKLLFEEYRGYTK